MRSSLDVAVQLEPKQQDVERARVLNAQRVAELTSKGQRFVSLLERAACWHTETFRFLKGRSRSIALANYGAEKAFVDKVPHQLLVGEADKDLAPGPSTKGGSTRRPKDCPF